MGELKLNQCPFCGSSDVRIIEYGCSTHAECICGATGPSVSTADEVRGAAMRWNDRTETYAGPIGWFTEDYQTDKSATTYDSAVAERWRSKGWPVHPLYLHAQPNTAQHGSAATPHGESNDDESNSGCPRRLAGGSNSGGRVQRPENGEQGNRSAEYDAGLPRHAEPKPVGQGNAAELNEGDVVASYAAAAPDFDAKVLQSFLDQHPEHATALHRYAQLQLTSVPASPEEVEREEIDEDELLRLLGEALSAMKDAAGADLPPLPEPDLPHVLGPLFTAEQMQEYARAAIAKATGAQP